METGQPSAMPSAAELEASLKRHVIDVWFPRSLDREYGGFLCDFDHRWKPCGPNAKLLKSQARHTCFAAEASRAYPEDKRLRDAMEHGFSYLREALWDQAEGGWFRRLDRAGQPVEACTKHTHGLAYSILACVAVYETTGNQRALDLAREGFEWMFRHARDERYGGFFSYMRRDGTVIRDVEPGIRPTDAIKSRLGCKDMRVHSALLGALTQLNRCWPRDKVADQLIEMVDIICNRMATPLGAHHQYCLADWTPLPHLTRFGNEFYNAIRLLEAGRYLVIKNDAVSRHVGLWTTLLSMVRIASGEGFTSPGLPSPPCAFRAKLSS